MIMTNNIINEIMIKLMCVMIMWNINNDIVIWNIIVIM